MLISALTAIMDVVLIAAALENWLYTIGSLSWSNRILIGVSGIFLLIPNLFLDLAGILITTMVYLFLYFIKNTALEK